MRSFFYFIATVMSCLVMMSCSITKTPTVFNPTYVQEHWQSKIEKNANKWKMGASRWFLLAEPNEIEMANRRAPSTEGVSTIVVDSGNFQEIHTNGNYQLQIFGSDKPSVYVYGPNAGTQAVEVRVSGDTLFISQTRPVPIETMERVIVRVGVCSLKGLTQAGNGTIEAIHLVSPGLCISAPGNGKIYLAGHYVLDKVNHTGNACIYLFGARSSCLKILSTGNGLLNISGSVGLRSIKHTGGGEINIIGAHSRALNIDTSGSGKIGLCGPINLCSLCASGKTCVYISDVRGKNNITVNLTDSAQVGLAGTAPGISVTARCSSRFFGRYLCTHVAYANASGCAHINVTAAKRAYTSASKNSTVYYFGETGALESFASDYASIFPLPGLCSCKWYTIPVQPRSGHHRRMGLRGQG